MLRYGTVELTTHKTHMEMSDHYSLRKTGTRTLSHL